MHGQPHSQRSDIMKEKEAVGRVLLERGLTPAQVRAQLRCSRYFIDRIVKNMQSETHSHPQTE